MFNRFTLGLSALLLAGCSTLVPSVPPNYTGPQARLEDSLVVHNGSKADIFAAEQLNGQDTDNSIRRTQMATQGRGFALAAISFGRPIVAGQTVRVGVRGRTVFAAPIQALTSTVYQVKGVVEFVPDPDAAYVVRGDFGDAYSAVWIEESTSKAVVGKKVEVQGSAKLGILEK